MNGGTGKAGSYGRHAAYSLVPIDVDDAALEMHLAHDDVLRPSEVVGQPEFYTL